jgi:PleD family two-component response regulator
MQSKKILAVLDDLMFTVKIHDLAKRGAMAVEFLKSEIDVLLKAKEKPALIIIDLNAHSVNAVRLIQALKAEAETKSISIIAYVSHIQAELKQKAQEAGCDVVLARSAFSTNLPGLLKRHGALL